MYTKGDSGYGQQPWLFTPIRSASVRTNQEMRYNIAHKKARHQVERCIGVLKSRFRCLCRQRILMYDPATAGSIINACAVLHNIMIASNYPLPNEEEILNTVQTEGDDEETAPAMSQNVTAVQFRMEGTRARSQLINSYF